MRGQFLQIGHKGHHEQSKQVHRTVTVRRLVAVVKRVQVTKEAFGSKAAATQGSPLGTPTPLTIALGALMGGGVRLEFASWRGCPLLLLGGQALVQQRTVRAALGCPIVIQPLGVGAGHVFHHLAVGTHQLPSFVPEEGIRMKNARCARATPNGDSAKDMVGLKILVDLVTVKGAVESESLGQPLKDGKLM